MTDDPTWVITDRRLRDILHRAHGGEEPNTLLAELHADSVLDDITTPQG